MRTVIFAAGMMLAVLIAGCSNPESQNTVQAELDTLRLDKTKLTREVEVARSENNQLKQQIQTLSEIQGKRTLDDLYNIQWVKIGKYTNIYNKNKDGMKNLLIVYFQPIDEDNDVIKATGQVEVELWDLDNPEGQAKLGQWEITPQQLKNKWYSSVMSLNYRLEFDVTNLVQKYDHPLTLKLKFTDYLRGKVFNEQKVIEPRAVESP